MRADIVVVGAGIAGVSAIAAMRGAGFDGSVLLVGDEPTPPYRRPTVSKELVRGSKTPEQALVKQEPWYAEHGVELLTGTRAVALDIAGRTLRLQDGTPVGFDRLLLATGGRARAPWKGDRILTLRTMADAEALRAAAADVEDVVVIGAGLVGSEIAASLRALGKEVTLLESAAVPLPRLLPGRLAERYVALHAAHGATLETSVAVADVAERGDQVVVTASDGRSWRAGLAVVAVGMEPSLDLALGLEVDKGIAVDGLGRTSAPGIFAAGDATTRPSSFVTGRLRCEHWQTAQNHGTAVGKVMAGSQLPFDEVPWAWSEQYDVNLQMTGWPSAERPVVVRGDPDGGHFTAFTVDEGVLRGAVTIGRPSDVRAARGLIAQRSRVSVERLTDPVLPVSETVVR